MIREFEANTEEEAVDKAITSLGLAREDMEVEVIEQRKGMLFRKGRVRIRVHLSEETENVMPQQQQQEEQEEQEEQIEEKTEETVYEPIEDVTEEEEKIIEFLEGIITRMGYTAQVDLVDRGENKIILNIDSEYSAILIGKKGKNLDSIQLLVNVFAGNNTENRTKVIVDAENYRSRREDTLIRLARNMARQVKRSRSSKLLEPMNPFERRLIHTALNDFRDVETESEGEGLFKQVRIFYSGRDGKYKRGGNKNYNAGDNRNYRNRRDTTRNQN